MRIPFRLNRFSLRRQHSSFRDRRKRGMPSKCVDRSIVVADASRRTSFVSTRSAHCSRFPAVYQVLSSEGIQRVLLKRFSIPFVLPLRQWRSFGPWLVLCVLAFTCGCERFKPAHIETVYVTAQKMYLRDRVAPVSRRVAEVVNGEPLQVLDRQPRFLKVKTQKNQVGWIVERAVIDEATYKQFVQLAEENKGAPVVATATLNDELYMHVLPGRHQQHFYLLPGNTKVQLLARASVPKEMPAGGLPPAIPQAAPPTHAGVAPGSKQYAVQLQPAPTVMEDWWLARDSQGHTGWVLGSRLWVDAPESIEGYCEGQRIVGAYELTKVTDPEASTPGHEVPEYVTILAPLQSGLPYDFDEVRVFTWSVRHHRYETAFRLRPIQGFLPMRVSTESIKIGPARDQQTRQVPAFSFLIANGANLTTDPSTGITRPASPRTIRYVMIDTTVKRIGPDLAPIPLNRAEEKKAKTEKTAHKRGR